MRVHTYEPTEMHENSAPAHGLWRDKWWTFSFRVLLPMNILHRNLFIFTMFDYCRLTHSATYALHINDFHKQTKTKFVERNHDVKFQLSVL